MRPTRRAMRSIVAGVGVAALAAATFPGSASASGPKPPGLAPTTRADLLSAMHGEAFARASYLAYGAEAARSRHNAAAKLFRNAAKQELGDHFALEASFAGLVGDNAHNLRDVIAGESYETTTMYPQFAAQARADGDLKAAALFTEIGGDEAKHRDLFKAALEALPRHGTIPKPPAVDKVTVPAGPAKSHGRTLRNLLAAMHGEAFASAKYLAYADRAKSTGHSGLATLYRGLSEVERGEHFAAEAVLAGLVSKTRDNLLAAAKGENWEATQMYPHFAARAAAAGDKEAAAAFREIAGDEAIHRDAFRKAAQKLSR